MMVTFRSVTYAGQLNGRQAQVTIYRNASNLINHIQVTHDNAPNQRLSPMQRDASDIDILAALGADCKGVVEIDWEVMYPSQEWF